MVQAGLASDARVVFSIGPAPPPQAAKAFVRVLFGLGGSQPSVTAVLQHSKAQSGTIEFLNAGATAARQVTYLIVGGDGRMMNRGQVGDIQPGDSVAVPLPVVTWLGDHVTCVWTCLDDAARAHTWSYDGRHKRFKRGRRPTEDECFRIMYPDANRLG